jgi:predicted ATP-dependent endonuclease of OLD family
MFMHITKIEIKDIRTIEKLSIDFTSDSKSIILSGDNGSGKSTILRCIAMGITDEDSAASVLRDSPGEFVKKGQAEGVINVYLTLDAGQRFRIQTKIKSLRSFEKVYQRVFKFIEGRQKVISQEIFPWDKIFVVGYGAGVRNLGTADYQYYVAIDALYSLFKYDVTLQNPELSMRRIIDSARKRGKNDKIKSALYAKEMEDFLTNKLKRILNLDIHDRVSLSSTSIEIKSKWGRQELSTLGDGYISTTTWVLDLFSWWMLHLKLDHKNVIANKEIKGIVLIDEIEQHLHPKWQIKIMHLLRISFPDIQFISTTHSPLILSGEIDIPVLVLNGENPKPQEVSGWLAEDVYRDVMGLNSSRGIDVKNQINIYKELYFKKLKGTATKSESLKLSSLKRKLINALPSTDPVIEASELKNLTQFLNRANAKR